MDNEGIDLNAKCVNVNGDTDVVRQQKDRQGRERANSKEEKRKLRNKAYAEMCR